MAAVPPSVLEQELPDSRHVTRMELQVTPSVIVALWIGGPAHVCDVDWIDWSLLDVDLLFEPEYPVRAANGAAGRREGSAKRPVLSGDRGRPCLSLDLDSMVRDEMAPAARAAFDAFTRAIDLALNGLMLWSGDIAFVDNQRAVHGQEPFDARFDGTDPWFRQLKISRSAGGR